MFAQRLSPQAKRLIDKIATTMPHGMGTRGVLYSEDLWAAAFRSMLEHVRIKRRGREFVAFRSEAAEFFVPVSPKQTKPHWPYELQLHIGENGDSVHYFPIFELALSFDSDDNRNQNLRDVLARFLSELQNVAFPQGLASRHLPERLFKSRSGEFDWCCRAELRYAVNN